MLCDVEDLCVCLFWFGWGIDVDYFVGLVICCKVNDYVGLCVVCDWVYDDVVEFEV